MPLEDIVQRILSAHPDFTREEVFEMIEEKEKEAKGFLTRESAARAVASELGVETRKVFLKHGISIGDLVSGLNDVTVAGRVIFVHPLQKFARPDGTEGRVRRLLVADGTGRGRVALWDDMASLPDAEKLIGQIVRFSHSYVRRGFDGKPELNLGSNGALEIVMLDVQEQEYPPLTHFFKKFREIMAQEAIVSVVGVVDRVHPGSTFKRADGSEGKVRHLELRDETGRVNVVLWNDKVDELAEIREGEWLAIWKAKIRAVPSGDFELSVDGSVHSALLAEKPVGFENP